jgi:phosphoglycerate dehydrogenase-like enzyme
LPTGSLPAQADVLLVGGKPISLEYFPKLKGIFKCGVGRDNIPEMEASLLGISCGFPSPSTASIIYEETANFACHLIFKSLYSNLGNFNSWGKIDRKSLSNTNVLIVGTGNIGTKVVQKLKNFVRISTFDMMSNTPSELKEMIKQADCITLHLPLTESTRDMFDAEKLNWMKDGTFLVNTARAAIVSENALYNELKNGRLFAAFDVFWQEPYKGKLLEIPKDRFIRSPHAASNCKEFLQATANDFRSFLDLLKNKS